MIAVLLACVVSRAVTLVSPESAAKGAPTMTTFGPIHASEGQYSGTPSIFRCVVANGYVSVIQDVALPIPADLPDRGWCGDPEMAGSIPFVIARDK